MPEVAPRAGAWIETRNVMRAATRSPVAPRAGAWIETSMTSAILRAVPGRPPCGGVD